ncbi:ABC transporter permease/substrate-binding protein [Altererythrobacter sp. C41]|uniref:ABC transporter permease/substrate-binding protein n=1 Tax=Altererythrobacter sp. C41 TaxID=2806021 RepID=UPI00193127F6|nr:ABC transporter permease/substrate-binding protein [Altererythrobacter sp. C41]MBM0171138.1 ABC transporter permease/substrate-binding protein [Altererythrobacter sp. C41]
MSPILAILFGLGDKLAAHVLLSAAAIGLGIAVALPLAVWASRSPSVARIALGFASLVQTIPALALLALFFPILLSLRAVFGEGLPTLGFLPALLALALYALLPILRNAVTAREHMAPGVLEAADGVGMTSWQKLRLVEAPLAAPYVMAGVRTASVWTIGAATLSTTIGQASLGDPIFAGLQTQNWALVLAGCIASAALALMADLLLGTIERGFAARRKRLVWGAGTLALLGIAAAAYAQLDLDKRGDTVVIGAKSFSEQYILARLIGQRLRDAGYAVEYRDGLGSAVVHDAIATGAIDISVDYTGTLWSNEMKRDGNPGREAIYQAIVAWERETNGIRVLGRLGFENAYALAIRENRARELGVRSLADLAPVASRLTVGGDPEFFRRPEWFAVRERYGLSFGRQRTFTPTFMYNALRSGEADVIGAYTSDGRIAADRLVVLEDPKGAFPAYDALLLIAPDRAEDRKLAAALEPLVGVIHVEAMRDANLSVDRAKNKLTPAEAARELAERLQLPS